jgi:hypothetical protein
MNSDKVLINELFVNFILKTRIVCIFRRYGSLFFDRLPLVLFFYNEILSQSLPRIMS